MSWTAQLLLFLFLELMEVGVVLYNIGWLRIALDTSLTTWAFVCPGTSILHHRHFLRINHLCAETRRWSWIPQHFLDFVCSTRIFWLFFLDTIPSEKCLLATIAHGLLRAICVIFLLTGIFLLLLAFKVHALRKFLDNRLVHFC